MAVGTQPSWAYLNAQATQIVLQARDAIDAINKYNTFLQGLGATNLEAIATAGNSPSPTADVTQLMSIFADLAEVAVMCGGGPIPVDAPKNFVGQTVPLWNAQ